MGRGLRYASVADLPAHIRKQIEGSPNGKAIARVLAETPIAKGAPRGRTSKLEAAYGEHLEWQKREGVVRSYQHHAITLLVGNDCRYTPDYVVTDYSDNTIALHEVKGPRAWEDSIVKLKAAATIFPYFEFYLVTRGKDGAWQHKLVQGA